MPKTQQITKNPKLPKARPSVNQAAKDVVLRTTIYLTKSFKVDKISASSWAIILEGKQLQVERSEPGPSNFATESESAGAMT